MLSLQGYGIQHNTMFSFPSPSPSTSPSQPSLHCIKRAPDFTFCNVSKRKHQEKHEGEDGIHDADTVLPLPLWSKKIQSSYTCPSNTARLQAMVEGRKKLMEMMEDLPEYSYELSLKDMVVEDQEGNLEIMIEERSSSNLKPKSKDKKECQQRKRPISRSISLDTGVFLLRMFTPSSFGLKKPNKVSRMSSMDSSIKRPVDREWLKTRFYVRNKSSFSSNSDGSSNNSSCSSSNSLKTREAEGIFKRFFWFVNATLCKPRSQ